ncbi:MAG: hypothetical protein VKK62_00190 [Synechococcaceae cyanobacterium]|nr:hypothetical protein [Synechococcaceae cyanobacterium]
MPLFPPPTAGPALLALASTGLSAGLAPLLLEWRSWLSGAALWALALYLPLSLPLAALERRLAGGDLPESGQTLLLVGASLGLALAAGVACQLLLAWALGPDWATSLGLVLALWGPLWSLARRSRE